MSDSKIELVPIDAIKFDPKNANKGTKRGEEAISESIEDFGYLEAGTLDRDNTLIGGNKRTKAAAAAGIKDALIIDVEGDTAVFIRRRDLDLDSQDADTREKSRRAAYALNRAAELSLSWDVAQLEDDIAAGLDLSNLFAPDELDKMMIKARALPPITDQEEPTLVSDHYIQIYCSAADLERFGPILNEWMQSDTVTINVA